MIVSISQARMGSSRLPGKVLMDLQGRPVLKHHIEKVKATIEPDKRIIATGRSELDDPIERFCHMQGVRCFRGDDLDVLDRYYQCAKAYKASIVVRLTSDCPHLDPYLVDQIIRAHLYSDAEYTSNTLRRTFAKGLDVEVFDFDALERAWNQASDPVDREHVTRYIYTSGKFKLQNFAQLNDESHENLCVDTQEDLNRLERRGRCL